MKNILFWVVGALLIIWLASHLLSPFLSPYLAQYLLGNTYEVRNRIEFPSPSKSIVAESFNVYGGATSTDVTQVLIRPRNAPFDLRGNFCLLSIDGLKRTKIRWISDTKLEIQYQSGGLYRKAPEWNDVSVTYSELDQ